MCACEIYMTQSKVKYQGFCGRGNEPSCFIKSRTFPPLLKQDCDAWS
jgi:hypothetical protein